MSTLLDSFAPLMKPELLGAVGKALGADSSAIGNAVGAAGPLLLDGLSRSAAAPGGADALLKLLPADTEGLLGNLGNLASMLGGLSSAGGSSGTLNSILGSGTNAIGAALSRQLGFNVTPLLGMAAPALLGVISKAVKSGNLNAASLTTLLSSETTAWKSNPANSGTLSLINTAMEAGDQATATIKAYGSDWDKVIAGPVAALFLVASADPSGPIGAVKEAKAAHEALLEGARKAAPTSLIAAAFASGLTKEALDILRKTAPSRANLMDALKTSIAAVRSRSPDEAGAYTALIQSVGNATATAAKDGGFLGIGGTPVSKDEQQALDAIKAALA